MPTPKKTRKFLMVVPNPFAAIDHENRCSGAFPHEPSPHNDDTDIRHVGAKRHAVKIREANPQKGIRELHEHVYEFSHEPVKVTRSEYYRRGLINRGPTGDPRTSGQPALLPADEETHKWAGLPGPFRDPLVILAQKSAEIDDLTPLAMGEHAQNLRAAAHASGGATPVDESAEPVSEPPPIKTWDDVLAPHKEKYLSARKASEDQAVELRKQEALEAAKNTMASTPASHADTHSSDYEHS